LIEGIDGQGDMKLTFGTIVVEERGRLAKEDKVRSTNLCSLLYFF